MPILEKLRELMAAATRLPWPQPKKNSAVVFETEGPPLVPGGKPTIEREMVGRLQLFSAEDQALIIGAVNALPELLEQLAKAQSERADFEKCYEDAADLLDVRDRRIAMLEAEATELNARIDLAERYMGRDIRSSYEEAVAELAAEKTKT
jgi:hypothetical protein